jgi:hypothetical protein
MARNARPKPGQEISRRTISKVVRYKVWDCSSCGIKGLNSNKCRQCPQCGNSKDASDHEERSQDIVDANYKFEGADITCQFCGTHNEARFSCSQCGAALDKKFEKQVANFVVGPTALAMPVRKVQIDDAGFLPDATDTPWTAGSEPVTLPEPKDWEDNPPEPKPDVPVVEEPPQVQTRAKHNAPEETSSTENTSGVWPLIIAAVVAMLLITFVYVYNQLHSFAPTSVTVSVVSWSYSLPREDYASRDRSYETEDFSWKPPSEAFATKSELEFARYKPIYDEVWKDKSCIKEVNNSYDNTDGTWVEQIDEITYDCSGYVTEKIGDLPIYKVNWTWKVMAWEKTTPLTARGDSYVVQYPEFIPTSTLRQAGSPVTTFNITFTYLNDDGEREQATRSYPRTTWERTTLGSQYEAVIDGFDRLRAVSGLDPEYQELLE